MNHCWVASFASFFLHTPFYVLSPALSSSAQRAAVPEVSEQFHQHSGGWPSAVLHGGRGDPDSASDRSGDTAGGVGQSPQFAVQKTGAHRGYNQGNHCDYYVLI